MAQLMETAMLLCFGLSWPFNIMKSWNSRTAKGKSLGFELLILLGYALGIAGKFLSHNVSYVLVVYILDLLMVSTDLILTIRNKFLDKRADRRAEKEKEELKTALQEQTRQAEFEKTRADQAIGVRIGGGVKDTDFGRAAAEPIVLQRGDENV